RLPDEFSRFFLGEEFFSGEFLGAFERREAGVGPYSLQIGVGGRRTGLSGSRDRCKERGHGCGERGERSIAHRETPSFKWDAVRFISVAARIESWTRSDFWSVLNLWTQVL